MESDSKHPHEPLAGQECVSDIVPKPKISIVKINLSPLLNPRLIKNKYEQRGQKA